MINKEELIKAAETLYNCCIEMNRNCSDCYMQPFCIRMENEELKYAFEDFVKYYNIRCPFCGKKVIHVAVCDDIGNIKGLLKTTTYEDDAYNGLGYVLIHEGWGECLLCTDGDQKIMGGMIFDTPDEAVEALKKFSCKDNTNLY